MNKPNVKTNPEITNTLEADIRDHRNALREANEVMTLKDHPGWQRLQKNLQNQIEGLDFKLDNFEKLSERELVLHLKERKDWRWLESVVEKVEAGYPQLEADLGTLEKRLSERKAKSGQL